MKTQVSTVAVAAAIVVVLVIVGFFGYRTFARKSSSGAPPPEAQKWLPGNNPGGGMAGRMRPTGPGSYMGGGYGNTGGPPPGYAVPGGR